MTCNLVRVAILLVVVSIRILRGFLYTYLLFGNLIANFYLLACPCTPICLLYPPLTRKLTETFTCYWEIYVFNISKIVKGLNGGGGGKYAKSDHMLPDESAIILMNHPSGLDWNFFFGATYLAGMPYIGKQKLKIILRNFMQHLPGFGLMAQMNGYIFIDQFWEKDKKWLDFCLEPMISRNIRFKMLIFPEGAGFAPSTKESSNEYARLRGLPEYEYVLHPKTTGFNYLVTYFRNAKQLDAIYDFTIGYPDIVPRTVLCFLLGKLPKEVHFHVKRIPVSDLPKDEKSLKSWLEDRWKQKERVLKNFYENKRFNNQPWGHQYDRSLFKMLFFFWTSLTVLMTFLLIFSPIFRLWVLFWTVSTFCISTFWTITLVEIKWYRAWKSIFKIEDKEKK